ncbi:HNH endonuclease [Paenibacillus cymbidii]|uniref:HNH endonuclease n=1 Tax=Paenibacillus cymbidii TaxID=1639034 RepID=UPI00108041F0|nr:HNH endonuclease [Paenibacillus cymbidii]
MKSWARAFYNSKAWLICRAAYIAKVFGLCERCGAPGKIVHHTVWLTPQNINDPSISLNHDLLEYLCQDCHNKEHMGSHEPVVAEGLRFDEYGNLVEVRGCNQG